MNQAWDKKKIIMKYLEEKEEDIGSKIKVWGGGGGRGGKKKRKGYEGKKQRKKRKNTWNSQV